MPAVKLTVTPPEHAGLEVTDALAGTPLPKLPTFETATVEPLSFPDGLVVTVPENPL